MNRRLFWLIAVETTAIVVLLNGVKVAAGRHAMKNDAGSAKGKLALGIVGSL